MRLTKTVIDSAKYRGATDYRWDSTLPSFGVRVYPSGRKSFVVSYRSKGRKRIMVLGGYGALTLKQARNRARQVLANVAGGGDPSGARKGALQAPTMAQLAERYLEEHARPRKKASSLREDERMWRMHILPRLGNRKVADVTREDVVKLHTRMKQTPYAGNRVVALLSKAFNLAEVWGLRPDASNPCRHVKKYKERKVERYLSGEELGRLAEVLAEAEWEQSETPSAIAAVRLLVFTGCRLGEVLSLRWRDVDFERRCLRLPDSKTGEKTVFLNAPALQVLASIDRRDEHPYVFPGRNPERPLVNLKDPWRRLRKKAGLEDVRLHDLRHTFASYGVAAGFSLPLIGKMLGHTQAATTERYAHLAADPVRQASERIGEEIEAAMSGRRKAEVAAINASSPDAR